MNEKARGPGGCCLTGEKQHFFPFFGIFFDSPPSPQAHEVQESLRVFTMTS
jgi:hypothetical protein